MLISFAVMAMLNSSHPNVEFVDSDSDQKMTWVVVDGSCPVPVAKADLKNTKKILEKVNEVCDLDLQFNEKE